MWHERSKRCNIALTSWYVHALVLDRVPYLMMTLVRWFVDPHSIRSEFVLHADESVCYEGTVTPALLEKLHITYYT